MSFKHINPGYAELLDVAGGTTIVDTVKSRTGVKFYQPTAKKGINLSSALTDFYGKYDVYIGNDYNSFSTRAALLKASGYSYSGGIGFTKDSNVMYFYRYYNGNSTISSKAYTSSPETLNIKLDAINTFWFHVAPGSPGRLEIYSNGVLVDSIDSTINLSDSTVIDVYANNANGAISNLILSDSEIDKKEQVAILPISATETTMTAGENGEYIAGAAGQTVLQTVDVSSLINDYGADTDIKGIAVIGNPAYRTAEGLCNMTALQHDGTTLTEYGTKTAPASNTGIVADGHALSLKLPALANYKFGWKAGV